MFAFVGYMVVDFGLSPTEREAGKYAGYIAGSYWFGGVFGVSVFGWISDRWGRRPVLLLATVFTTITTVAFGFSPNLFWAVIETNQKKKK